VRWGNVNSRIMMRRLGIGKVVGDLVMVGMMWNDGVGGDDWEDRDEGDEVDDGDDRDEGDDGDGGDDRDDREDGMNGDDRDYVDDTYYTDDRVGEDCGADGDDRDARDVRLLGDEGNDGDGGYCSGPRPARSVAPSCGLFLTCGKSEQLENNIGMYCIYTYTELQAGIVSMIVWYIGYTHKITSLHQIDALSIILIQVKNTLMGYGFALRNTLYRTGLDWHILFVQE
jgi:hypothetical protein